MSTHEFLQALFAYTSGYLTLTAVHPSGKYATPSRHIHLKNSILLMKGLTDLRAANQQGWGAYFNVATRQTDLGRWRRGGNADLYQLPALFVDIDAPLNEALQRLKDHEPPPSCIVASGFGCHAYWFLDAPTQDWQKAQIALNTLRKDLQSDTTSPAQMMRLPNSINQKPSRHKAICRLLELNERRYPLEKFLSHIFDKTDQTDQTLQTGHFCSRNTAQKAERFTYPPTKTVHFCKTDHLNPQLVKAVCDCLIQQHGGFWRRNGWLAAQCPCPHQHDKAGQHFSFNPERALGVCLGKHGRMLLKELCNQLHIRPSDYGGLYRKE